MAEYAFEIQALKHSYGGSPVLEIDSLTIADNAITGLMGPNGSGKSTLLRLLGCIERPTNGRILFDGKPIEPFNDAARFLITLLPQEPYLLKRNVFNNVSYGLKLRGEKDMAERVHTALAMVGLPADRFARRPWYALSGGEAQRVALAARLSLKPKVLLLDEPTASVDLNSARLIKEAALQAKQTWGTSIVVAGHDRQWLNDICDDVLHMHRGTVIQTQHETIVFGPWENNGGNFFSKTLTPTARLKVSKPPHPDAAAVIRFFFLEDNNSVPGNDARTQTISGVVQTLNLDHDTGNVIANVICGNLSYNVPLTRHQLRGRPIFPGRHIDAAFHIDQIKWI